MTQQQNHSLLHKRKQECEKDILRIDEDLVSLLAERQLKAKELGTIERELGQDGFDSIREKKQMEHVAVKETQELSSLSISTIFSEIISVARTVQGSLRVAYLGPEASFSHQATLRTYGKSADLQPTASIEEVFDLVEKGQCYQGVVPIENLYEGSVRITQDLFYQYPLVISAEVYVRIRHHLLSKSKELGDITTICSHPMALAQCREWIRSNFPGITLKEVVSTSHAASLAAAEQGIGAIGNRLCQQAYDLFVLAENVEDHPDNITRFFVIGKQKVRPTGNDKTTLLFLVHHRAGALHSALSALAQNGVNITRIESRPMRGKRWEYLFSVDVEGHEEDACLTRAMRAMASNCVFLKNIGSYPAGGLPWE